MQKCREPVADFEGAVFVCVLPKGHDGEHQAMKHFPEAPHPAPPPPPRPDDLMQGSYKVEMRLLEMDAKKETELLRALVGEQKALIEIQRERIETLQAYIHAMNNRPVTDPLGTCQNCGEFAEFGHQC